MDIKSISYEISTQDNRATSYPLFCVFDKERIYGMDSDYSNSFEWFNQEGDETIDSDGGMSEDFAEENGYNKVYYLDIDRFINAHFTERAAKEHIRINGHNLNKPFIYVTSLFRCHEMISIRDFLKSGGNP